MDEAPETEPAPERPSLLQAGARLLRRIRLHVDREWRRTLRIVAGALLASLLAIGLLGWAMARGTEAETASLAGAAARSGADRRALEALARLHARPGMEESLRAVGGHVPADARLVAAARSDQGALAITLETADPDLLRNALAADPWAARLAERQQAVTPAGGMRVTLEAR